MASRRMAAGFKGLMGIWSAFKRAREEDLVLAIASVPEMTQVRTGLGDKGLCELNSKLIALRCGVEIAKGLYVIKSTQMGEQ